MSAPNVVVDHDASADYVNKLNALADEIDRDAPGYASAILDAFTQEASQGTATGEVAPLYLEAVAAMESLTKTLEGHFASLAAAIRSDAAALEQAVREVAEADEAGAAGVNGVGDISHDGGYVTRDNPVVGSGPAVGDIARTDSYVTRENDY